VAVPVSAPAPTSKITIYSWSTKVCPGEAGKTGKNCNFTWSETSTTSISWSFGGSVITGNSNNPKDKEWVNILVGIIPNWSRTTTKTEGIDLSSEVAPGDKAYAVKVAQMRWERGDFKGGFVRENRGCIVGVNGRGTLYRWEPDLRWGRWERSVPTGYEFRGIAINDRF
jgi:hypothetical protein